MLVVYAGAGHSRGASERFTDLTSISTTAGFIVAYADHRRLSIKVLDDLATIPAAVAQNWCINLEKVFFDRPFRRRHGGRSHGISPR